LASFPDHQPHKSVTSRYQYQYPQEIIFVYHSRPSARQSAIDKTESGPFSLSSPQRTRVAPVKSFHATQLVAIISYCLEPLSGQAELLRPSVFKAVIPRLRGEDIRIFIQSSLSSHSDNTFAERPRSAAITGDICITRISSICTVPATHHRVSLHRRSIA
jgi:hypothetical protein